MRSFNAFFVDVGDLFIWRLKDPHQAWRNIKFDYQICKFMGVCGYDQDRVDIMIMRDVFEVVSCDYDNFIVREVNLGVTDEEVRSESINRYYFEENYDRYLGAKPCYMRDVRSEERTLEMYPYKVGDVVTKEGDEGEFVFCVVTGLDVKVVRYRSVETLWVEVGRHGDFILDLELISVFGSRCFGDENCEKFGVFHKIFSKYDDSNKSKYGISKANVRGSSGDLRFNIVECRMRGSFSHNVLL